MNYTSTNYTATAENYHVYWSHTFEKGGYHEVWVISFIYTLISLGITFIRYPQMASIVTIFQQMRSQGSNMKDAFLTSWNQPTDLKTIGGLSFNVYIIHSAVLTLMYFIAKILLYCDASVTHSNHDFQNTSFHHWCSGQNVIVALIFFHTIPSSFDMIQKVWKVKTQLNNIYFPDVTLLLSSMFVIDLVGTLLLVSMKYGYIVYLLYLAAVGILTAGVIGITLVCWLPCFVGIVYGILLVFRVFACYQPIDKPLGRAMNDIGGGIAMNFLSYLIVVLLLTLHWSFIGGPPESTVVFSSQSYAIYVFSLITMGAIYGFIVAIIGIIITALKPDRTGKSELLMDSVEE